MPSLFVITGTVLIAIGGLLATYGWNAHAEATRRSAMIQSVAAEWMVNNSVISDEKFLATDKNELARFVMFPRTRTIALEVAITSGLFLEQQDRELFTQACRLHEQLLAFNQRLDFTEERMSAHPGEIAKLREKLRDGVVRKQVAESMNQFGKLLMSDFGISAEQEFFVDLNE